MWVAVAQARRSAELPRQYSRSPNNPSRHFSNLNHLNNSRSPNNNSPNLSHNQSGHSPSEKQFPFGGRAESWPPQNLKKSSLAETRYGSGSNTTSGWYVRGTTASAMAISFSCWLNTRNRGAIGGPPSSSMVAP